MDQLVRPSKVGPLDSRFNVFKILCGRAVIFHYSLWLKFLENSTQNLINAIMKIM